VACREFLVPRL